MPLPVWIWLVALACGIALIQWCSALPSMRSLVWGWLVCLGGVGLSLIVARSVRLMPVTLQMLRLPQLLRLLSVLGLCVLTGAMYSVVRAQARLADSLDWRLENQPMSVKVQVTGLPRNVVNGWVFEARLDAGALTGRVPRHVLLRWYTGPRNGPYAQPQPPRAGLPDVRPGQVWQMTVKLKRHHASRNFHGFDYDAFLFAQGVRASGTVVGAARLLRDDRCGSWRACIERIRLSLREALGKVLENKRYGPVIIALVMGDQNGISDDDWKVFNLTGITHLVSISGSHITMLAALGSVGVLHVWRGLRIQGKLLAERRPGQIAAAGAGLLVAGAYSVLAGWGVPAQRTFIMLALLCVTVIGRNRIHSATLLALAALGILLLDPWAVLSIGFCLSFSAIACLMLWGARSRQQVVAATTWRAHLWRWLGKATGMQLFMSLSLAPLLIGLFHQYALVSPLVNAFAIPLIGGVVTPLALLLALLCATGWWPAGTMWLAHYVHALLEWVLNAARSLSQLEWAAPYFPAVPGYCVVLGMLGMFLFVMPKGVPGRMLGLVLLIPVLSFRPPRPEHGDWYLTVLDVGQGAAVLISTQQHHVLFDTGVRSSVTNDSGSQVIVPYLRAQGVTALDQLIISHSDLDHIGGAGSVLQQLNVKHAYTSFALNRYLEYEQDALQRNLQLRNPQARFDFCQRGVSFAYDGVQFRFYHPSEIKGIPERADNNHSCVLRVQGQHHAVLLTGDIDAAAEAALLQARPPLPATDVVMAPHHGSASSSSFAFVQALQPAIVFAQAGYLNRYRHPAPEITRRWRNTAQLFVDTISVGAIQIRSSVRGLWVNSARASQRRYWDGF